MNEKKFWKSYYESFEGATIVKYLGMIEDDPTANGGFPSFEVKFKDGTLGTVEVSQDPEGNGGGFLFGGVMPERAGK